MNFTVVAGSYERLLFGFNFERIEDGLQESFIYPAHISCIKAVAAKSKFLATGSSDEIIKIYNLKLKREVGVLDHHTGTITSLEFYQNTHLITASEDGTIGIVRTTDWELLKVLKGHHGKVSCISIHPSGKLLLSVGVDSTLRTWNLARGIMAQSVPLVEECTKVAWSKDGTLYALLFDKKVEIHSLVTTSLI